MFRAADAFIEFDVSELLNVMRLQNYTNSYINMAGVNIYTATNRDGRFLRGRQQLFSLDKFARFCYYY